MDNNFRFCVLAPTEGFSQLWKSSSVDRRLHENFLRATQQFRGNIYVKDGAISREHLDKQGCYRMRRDEESWHILLVTPESEVVGCVRFLVHSNTSKFDALVLKRSALAKHASWGKKLQHSLETEIRVARSEGTPFVEIGGWALAEEWRGTRAALKILLAAYAWGGLIGGCRGACTATSRHGSASILRRVGGISFEYFAETLPSYYDPAYGCEMEILKFDSRFPNPRFCPLIAEVATELSASPLIINTSARKYSSLVA